MALVLVISACALAQSQGPNDGIVAFSTHEWGIDLASSTVHLSFPLRSKAGKIPYSSNLAKTDYYSVVVNSGTAYWAFWDQSGGDSALSVSISGTVVTQQCTNQLYWYMTYTINSIQDSTGAQHPLPHQFTWIRNNNSQGCINQSQKSAASLSVNDNSGYTIYADTTGVPLVYDKRGYSFAVAVPGFAGYGTRLFNGTSGPVTDPDGANISISNGVVTDTLGTPVLTSSGNGPYFESYTDASGNTTQKYTMTYTSLPLRTNFGCSSSIVENSGTQSLLASIQTPTGDTYTISREPTPGYSGYYTGRISQITFPSGGSISYAYSDSNGHNGIDCSWRGLPVTPPVPTITVTVNDNNGNSSTYTYVHSGNLSVPSTVTKTDPAGNQTVYTFTGEFQTQVQYYQGPATGTPLETVLTCYNGNTTNCTNPSSFTFPITQTDVYTSLGTSASNHVKTSYDSNSNVTSVVAYDFGATSPTSQTYTFYGQSWNGTSCTAYPTGTYIADTPCYSHTENSAGVDVAATKITYSNTGHPTSIAKWTSGSSWLTGTATYNTNGTVATSTDVNGALYTYAYNGTDGCNGVVPTSVIVTGTGLPSGGLTSSKQWDCNGAVVTKSFDANTQPTTTNYTLNSVADPLYRPLSVVDALNNSKGFAYTPTTFESAMNFGAVPTVDGLGTTDGLGRNIFAQKRQGQGVTTFDSIQTAYGWISATTGACTNQPPQPPQTTVDCTTQSVPYSGTAGQSAPGGTAVTTTQYDALGRPLIVADGGGGQTVYTYSLNDVLVTVSPKPSGENVKQTQSEYDGLGRLTSVCEITSAANGGVTCGQSTSQIGYWTRYKYDGAGRLIGVCQNTTQPLTVDCVQTPSAGQQTRTYSYDGVGRVTMETNPESGTTTYIYDSLTGSYCTNQTAYTSSGDQVAKSDANGNHVCYRYDGLHRPTDTVNNNQSSTNPCKRFRYDNSTGVLNGIPTGIAVLYTMGHVVEAETDTCAAPITQASIITDEWFSYSKRGENTDLYEATLHSGGYYHTTVAYWANGALQSLSGIPGYTTITYGLDGEGRLTSAQQGTTNLVCDTMCSPSSTSYNAAGQVVTINIGGTGTNGSGDNDTYTYDPATSRMTNYAFTVGSPAKAMTGALTWNQNGTLRTLAITDGFHSGGTQTCNYGSSSVMGYDDQGRLLNVNCGSVWSQTFTYDPFGNITKSGSISWIPGYNQSKNQYLTPANCITMGGTPCYDSDGNLTADGSNSYTWDASGKMTSINSGNSPAACGTSGTCLTYDAIGRMVEVNASGTFTEMLYSPIGKTANMSGSSTVNYSYLPLPGGATMYSFLPGGTARYFQHKDWLGSARMESGIVNRTEEYDRAFAPFGEVYDRFDLSSGVNFTGHTQDISSALFDTLNRELHPNQGRWPSPDPGGLSVANPADPQSWNRYTYVTNNPLSATDPLGLGDNNINNEIKNAISHACDKAIWTTLTGAPCGPGIPGYDGADPIHCFIDGIESDCSRAAFMQAIGAAAICPLGSTCVFNDHGLFQRQSTADDGWTWVRVNPANNVCAGPNPPIPCAPNNGTQQQQQQQQQPQPQQTPQQPKKQPWYCGTGNSWSHPFTFPTGRQWGQWTVADSAVVFAIGQKTGGKDPFSKTFAIAALVEGWGWASCD
jgi:RHS repeat-associated protein